MIKNILIISSNFTGHGHKSIAESLCEKFSHNDNVKIQVVDGFSLGGTILLNIAKAYGPITRKAENLWKFVWDISSAKPHLINEFIELNIKNRFLNLLKKEKPDLILSIHPNFIGSIIDILDEYHIKIPFVTLIADLVSITPLWADSRADYIIAPTVEAKNKCIEFGVSEKKIKVFGFPVRSRFSYPTYGCNKSHDINRTLNCIIMSGGEGVGNMKKIAEILLDNFNCRVKVVAGRNIKLKDKLEKSLTKKYGDRVKIYGFTKDIQKLMMCSDIAFTRGSPNVIMEVISCNVPLIITGALPGQEEENPEFVKKYNLGIVCRDIKEIQNVVKKLIDNNAEELKKIKDSQNDYNDSNAAEDIVNFILNIDGKFGEVSVENDALLIPKYK